MSVRIKKRFFTKTYVMSHLGESNQMFPAKSDAQRSGSTEQNAAPPYYNSDESFVPRAPPPSYEESQKHLSLQDSQLNHSLHTQRITTGALPSGIPLNNCNYSLPSQHSYEQPDLASTSVTANPKVVTLAKGAKLRTMANGLVNIPPPPPGCAPTAGQVDAMRGLPVLVKKKKRSFF